MTSTDAASYVSQMCVAADDALAFLGKASREECLGDRMTQQAVVMSLMIIGEAVARDRKMSGLRFRPS